MRILYLTQWFEPEPAFKGAEFAESLAAAGHHVEIATGFPNYPGGKLYDGYRLRGYKQDRTAGGLRIHRLFLFPSHDRSAVGRMLNYVSFFVSCLIFGLARGRRFDVVYVYHPPITPALAMALVARLHRFRLVIDIQDLWPDSVAASRMASGWMVRVLESVCSFVYKRAAHVVVQAEGMRDRLIARGVPGGKITRIYNWATYRSAGPESAFAPPAEFRSSINVVYGGNIGQAQALKHVVDAMEIARKAVPALKLHLFGSGIERADLERQAAERPASGLIVHQPVDRQAMDRIFDSGDILVLHLKDDPLYEFTIPSKTQHYLACGKPIVAGLSGEAAAILKESGAAAVSPPEDSAALAEALVSMGRMSSEEREALGARARSYYQARFTMTSAVERTLAVIDEPRGDRPELTHASD